MVLGLTRAELGLVAFIFALVYAAVLMPKVANRLSAAISGRAREPKDHR